jgi:hypothetical protein
VLDLANVVFTDSTKVTLPGVTLHLKYCAENGHSHSKGDTTIYFEEKKCSSPATCSTPKFTR